MIGSTRLTGVLYFVLRQSSDTYWYVVQRENLRPLSVLSTVVCVIMVWVVLVRRR